MTAGKTIRLSKLAREFNVGIHTIVEFLHKKGFDYDTNPNTKVSAEAVELLEKEYKIDLNLKKESEKIILKSHRPKQEVISIDNEEEELEEEEEEEEIEEEEVEEKAEEKTPEKPGEPEPSKAEKEEEEEAPVEKPAHEDKIKVVGKIDLEASKKAAKKKAEKEATESKKEKKAESKEKPKTEEKTEPPKEEQPEEIKAEKEQPQPEIPEEKVEKEEEKEEKKTHVDDVKVVGRINLEALNQKTRPSKKSKKEREKEREERRRQKEAARGKAREQKKETTDKEQEKDETIKAQRNKLNGPTVVGKIDLPEKKAKKHKDSSEGSSRKKRRKRIKDPGKIRFEDKPQEGRKRTTQKLTKQGAKKKKPQLKKEVDEEEVQKQIKNTLARLTSKGKSKGSKHRRDKRAAVSEKKQADLEKSNQEKKILKATEFVSVSELANMMDVNVNEVISTCMSLGLFVSINQRLDAETLTVVADEFGYKVEFVSADIQESIDDADEEDSEENLVPRSPIVTVMGHVDHGKTSLLDYIRSTNVIAGEAGGITQHIGAYHVTLDEGKDITFLDTPGHEAFTAMRARGAQVTDIAIIIVAADDNVMPQTVEAINHASAAGVPIVFAINKIDKPGANPERIKEELANMNYLVEEWGGKYQSHDISAKQGKGIEDLLEKVLLEAEMLELNANPKKRAAGTIIESSLDRGRGYVATVLVQSGTLKSGDIVLAGQYFGHIKAMFNERNQKIEEAGPAQPAIILGLDGAPQAGDNFHVMENERDARGIANKREQLAREQGLRSQKHITLDEIGRRIAIGNFQELNLIIKGDVDGSVEALSDSLIKLSTEEIQVNVKHKAVGQISESDILLAAASEAIVIGFQVRPSLSARKLAEREQIDIRLYSIIYDAINEIRTAMEGMLSPDIKEEITGTAEVMEVFKITKVGSVAGCIVRDGKINRNSKVRVIRDGIVIYTGNLGSLKRFKDDAKEVKNGYECGLNVENFNDIKVGDHVEAFQEVEVAKHL
ncbi:bacterial translation initiation factor 2 (bIF-2) [Tangfeifania diversioriginum]|uniref:Translation initiation factor IF-2 n=1 Tax=Tangfeifania diversioriginum TaxID=1168035 RepID=A0A1M6AAF3_9BACT|nr:translation initiation factor IF-2 [Tangfeifania diversioriginum]SHI33441.1 bacterial translation initiation factor 2 (bIF-2) [Tangfeifania diversioriginum]